jgi:chemotaxis signal transduction protein
MKANAWIISITDTVSVSVGEFELIHILPDTPELFNVPRAPVYCQQVLVWQNKIIPVMNLAQRFGLKRPSAINSSVIASIFAYRAENTGLPEYGALLLTTTPRRSEVSDDQACPLPSELYLWTHYVRSCFQETETKKAIPILKLELLFGHQDGV